MRHVDRDDYLDERDSHLQGEEEQMACEWCDGTGWDPLAGVGEIRAANAVLLEALKAMVDAADADAQVLPGSAYYRLARAAIQKAEGVELL